MTELTAERIAELRRVANSSKAQRYGLSGVLSLDEFAELMDAVEGALLGPTSLNQVITAEALRSAYYGEIAAERNRLAASLAKVRALLAGAACDGCALAEEITEALDAPTEPAPELVRAPDAPTQVSTSPNPSEEQQ